MYGTGKNYEINSVINSGTYLTIIIDFKLKACNLILST